MGDPEDPPPRAEPTEQLDGYPEQPAAGVASREPTEDLRPPAPAPRIGSEETTDDLIAPPVAAAWLPALPGARAPSQPSSRSSQPLTPGPSGEATEILTSPPSRGEIGPYLPPLLSRTWVDVDLPLVDAANYERIGEHARGGLGRIVKARDTRTGRVVALKEVIAGGDVVRQRFTREALITANLQHPSIVPVYELGRWESGEPFYAMKLVAGRSLAEVLKGATLDQRLARLPVILSVAEALAYAHERRIVHRDLKPANVLVGEFGETVVIDWGLAKSVDEIENSETDIDRVLRPLANDLTVVGAVVGTPAYMSPEQARGEQIDERSDVYAIGALLYHLIAGHRPYLETPAKTSRDIVDLVAAGAPAPLHHRESGAPPELITIVNKAMARDREARYANAGQLADDLRRFLTGQLVAAHHYNRTTLFLRWLKRHRAPVTVGAILATLLVVVGALGVRGVLTERDRVRAQRDIAVGETARAERQLAAALYEKGRVAETAHEWTKAAMYYAASRVHHDTPRAAWAAGLAEARAVTPSVRYDGHHGAWVHAVAISPDGSKVATVDDAGGLRVWAPSSGHTFVEIKAAKVPLYAVAFSPDGSELALGGDDGVIQRHGIDGAIRTTQPAHTGRIWSLAYSPDGATLASSGEDAKVKLWPLRGDGKPRELSGHIQRVYSVAFSADGRTLASGSDDRHVWLWDVATGKGASRGNHQAGGIRVVTFAGDAVVTSGWDHEVRYWPADRALPPAVWSDTHIVHGAAVDPSGELVITGGESERIRVWDISTRRLATVLDAPGGQTSAIAFSRDGAWFVTAGKTPPIAWNARPLSRLHGVGHREDVVALELTADGRTLVSGSTDRTIRFWDLASTREVRRITTRTYCSDGIAPLPGDELIMTCDDHSIRRYDKAGAVRELKTSTWLRFVSVSPDGTTLAAGHVDGNVALVDLASWKILSAKKLHAHHIYDVTFAHDGRLVTASLDDHLRTWRGADLTPDADIVMQSDDGVLAGALSPDGKLLAAGGQDGFLRAWDIERATWRAKRKDLAAGTVWMLRFTPDGTRAITANDDGGVRVWNTTTWADPIVLAAGEGTVLSLAITPDGRTAIAGYKSGAIVIWDLTTNEVRTRIGGHVLERGSCAELEKQSWADPEHAATVKKACSASAAAYFGELAKRSHQEIDEDVDVHWTWR